MFAASAWWWSVALFYRPGSCSPGRCLLRRSHEELQRRMSSRLHASHLLNLLLYMVLYASLGIINKTVCLFLKLCKILDVFSEMKLLWWWKTTGTWMDGCVLVMNEAMEEHRMVRVCAAGWPSHLFFPLLSSFCCFLACQRNTDTASASLHSKRSKTRDGRRRLIILKKQ